MALLRSVVGHKTPYWRVHSAILVQPWGISLLNFYGLARAREPAAFARVFLREPTKLDQFGLGPALAAGQTPGRSVVIERKARLAALLSPPSRRRS